MGKTEGKSRVGAAQVEFGGEMVKDSINVWDFREGFGDFGTFGCPSNEGLRKKLAWLSMASRPAA